MPKNFADCIITTEHQSPRLSLSLSHRRRLSPPSRDAKIARKVRKKKNRFFDNTTFNSGVRPTLPKTLFSHPWFSRPRRVITLHLRRNRCHLAVDLLNNVIYGTECSLSFTPGSTRLDSNQAGSTRLDSTQLTGPFSRVSRRPYRRVLERAFARTRRSSPGAPRFSFVRRAERRGNNGGIFAAKLKPPTDFSYSADERRRAESSLMAHLR